MNKVIVSGRLTRDVETRYTQSGKAYINTGIAVDRKTKDKTADFFNLVAWDKLAEIMGKYLKKGALILVDGHLQFNQYEDKNGDKKSSVNIVVDNFDFLDNRSKSKDKDDDDKSLDEADLPF